MEKILFFLKKHYLWIFFFLILGLHIFLRFYNLATMTPFGWDQVDTAWAAKSIIVDHKVLLSGPDPRGGAGLYTGPAYYYLAAFFYFLTNLDPIASGIFAGAVSVFTYLGIFYVIKKIFSFEVSIIAVFIYAVSSVGFDKVQWGVNFIPLISIFAFYGLYKIVIDKNEKFMLLVAFILGAAFQVHFTTIVFIPLITLLTLPFFPRTKRMIKYLFLSLPLFLIWLVPALFAILGSNHYLPNSLSFANTYYHGFHLRRMLQLANDAFIEFPSLESFKPIRFIFLPLFFLAYLLNNYKKNFRFFYIILLWFIVPWVVLSLYSGEITNYYFAIGRPIVLVVLSYIIYSLIKLKMLYINLIILALGVYFCYVNFNEFTLLGSSNLESSRARVKSIIKSGGKVPFERGSADYYLYYLYSIKK